jgi:hypothetical protein
MMRLGLQVAAVLLLTVTSYAQDVRFNFDQDADFAKYKTFKWVPSNGGSKVNDLLDKQIKSTIEAELAKKGLSKSEGTSDLNVSYAVALSQREEVRYTGTGTGVRCGGMGTVYGDTYQIPVGALAIDMADAGKNQLVWRGVGSKDIDPKAKPEKQQKNLAKAVEKLLKNYPPKKKE